MRTACSRTRTGGVNASATRVMIGREDSGIPRSMNGAIDQVQIYNRVLSAAEIQSVVTRN